MGMPVTLDIVDRSAKQSDYDRIFNYFTEVDNRFSTYKQTSEITELNGGLIALNDISPEMRQILTLAEQTKKETDGYFDVGPIGRCDPSGIVKGWAIDNAAKKLKVMGFKNYSVNAGGDIQASGLNRRRKPWTIGVRHPFEKDKIVKKITIGNGAVATSGTYERGEHIYNPLQNNQPANEIVSLTVIGPNILDADRFATAAFAMGRAGINFIESLPGYEGYQIDHYGQATLTTNLSNYLHA